MARTIQLRRYRLHPGALEPFTAWFTERLIPAREVHGFHVEFAYAVPETDEFVWGVSVDGDAEAFRTIDERYAGSPERAAAFDGVPQRVDSVEIALVTPVV